MQKLIKLINAREQNRMKLNACKKWDNYWDNNWDTNWDKKECKKAELF